MSYPVSQLIYRAYRLAGVITEAGRFYSQSQSDDALAVLNSMLDEWQTERIMAWAKVRTVFPLVANQQIYSIGDSRTGPTQPDYDFQRPEVIEQAGFIFTNVNPTIEQPMRILSQQEWAALTPKQLTSTIPTMLYYEQTVPYGLIYIWAIPTTTWGLALALYLWTNLAGSGRRQCADRHAAGLSRSDRAQPRLQVGDAVSDPGEAGGKLATRGGAREETDLDHQCSEIAHADGARGRWRVWSGRQVFNFQQLVSPETITRGHAFNALPRPRRKRFIPNPLAPRRCRSRHEPLYRAC